MSVLPARVSGFLLILMVGGFALSQACTVTTTVTVQGVGAVESTEGAEFRSAVSDALANALAQTTGVYIEQHTTLREVVRTAVQNTSASTSSEQELEQTVEQRMSGTVLRFEILESEVDTYQLEHVVVRATICLDKRILLVVDGDPEQVRTIAGNLRDATTAIGWTVVTRTGYIDPRDAYRVSTVALETGASIIATGFVDATETSQDTRTVGMAGVLTVTLLDTKNLEVLDTLELYGNGIGFTRAAALQDSLAKISIELSREMTTRFLSEARRTVAVFLIRNITRSNHRFTLEDALSRVPGVIRVTNSTYDASTRTVHLEAEVSADLCSIARELADSQRRILMDVDACGTSSAELWTTRE